MLVETFAAQYDVSPWPCNGVDPLDTFANVATRGQDRISLERAQCRGEGNDEWLGQSSSKLIPRGKLPKLTIQFGSDGIDDETLL